MRFHLVYLAIAVGLVLLGPAASVAVSCPSDSNAAAMITYMINANSDRPYQAPVHQIWLYRINSDSTGWDHVWKTSFFSRLSDSMSCFPITDTGIVHLLELGGNSTFCPPPIIRAFKISERVVSWEPGDSTEMIMLEMLDRQAPDDEDRFVFIVTPDNGLFTITQDIHERMTTWVEPIIQMTRKRMATMETALGSTDVEGVSFDRILLRDTP